MAGVNDITIISGILIFFIACGVILPYINDSFGGDSKSDNSINTLQGKVGKTMTDIDTKTSVFGLVWPEWILNVGKVFMSILGVFFWSFGLLPIFLEVLLFMPLRIILYLTIARNIWIGGGG